MNSRRHLKKVIRTLAADLYMAGYLPELDQEKFRDASIRMLKLIPRISHTEPGNVKDFYRQIYKEIDGIVSEAQADLGKLSEPKERVNEK